MSSLFEQFTSELSAGDALFARGLIYLAVTFVVGFVAAWLVAGRRHSNFSGKSKSIHALFYGITFPIMAFVLSWAAGFIDPTAATSALLRLAVPLFGALSVIRLVARSLRSLFPNSAPAKSLINITSIVVWLAFALYLLGLSSTIIGELEQTEIPIGKTRVSVMTLLQGLVLVAFTLLAALWASSAIEQRMNATSININTRILVSRLLRALLLVVALLFSLSAVGIDLTVLSVFGGALGVGLGLGLQRIAANYVSGFAMLVEGSFRVGDYVKLDAIEGTITQINSRYTVLQASNGRESVIPNETFMTQRVEHFSLTDTKISITSTLTLDYAANVELARALIVDAIASQPRVLTQPGPAVFVSGLTTDGVELTLTFWIADPANGQLALRSAINIAILQQFAANKIRLATPQPIVVASNDFGSNALKATVTSA